VTPLDPFHSDYNKFMASIIWMNSDFRPLEITFDKVGTSRELLVNIQQLKDLVLQQESRRLTFLNITIEYLEGFNFVLRKLQSNIEEEEREIVVELSESRVTPLEYDYTSGIMEMTKVRCREMLDNGDNNIGHTVVIAISGLEFTEEDEYDFHVYSKPSFNTIELAKLIAGTAMNISSTTEYETNTNINKLGLYNGSPTFSVNKKAYGLLKKEIKFVKDKDTEVVSNWINKMLVNGATIEGNKASLLKYTGNMKVLKLPPYLYVDPYAFADSMVEQLIITSPSTIITEGKFGGPGAFTNRTGKKIDLQYINKAKPILKESQQSTKNMTMIKKLEMKTKEFKDTFLAYQLRTYCEIIYDDILCEGILI
jgi:hypothetical protein